MLRYSPGQRGSSPRNPGQPATQRTAPANSADQFGDDVNVSTSSPLAALRRVLSLYLAGLFLASLGKRLWRLGEDPSLNRDG